MSELLPCPFCGGAVHWCGTPPSEDCNGCHMIRCGGCNALFDLGYGPADPENLCESLEELRAKIVPHWNRRATSCPTCEALERGRAVLLQAIRPGTFADDSTPAGESDADGRKP